MENNELIEQRQAKLKSIKDKGLLAFRSAKPGRNEIGDLLADFEVGRKVNICGRVMAKRSHGKASFMDLRDSSGKLQLYLKENIVGKDKFSLYDDLDMGDFLNVEGELFKTHTGEATVKVEDWMIISKALRPLPEKWHGLKDVDMRYRQRYLDLISNEEVKKVFLQRTKIIKGIRNFLDDKGFQEVETPMMHNIAGGAAGRPFKTHHNEYHMDLFMRIAPELYLKKLLVGGFDKVYEINRSFRNEGVSTRHNPEFTMLEIYAAYANYEDMMSLAENLITTVAEDVLGKPEFVYQGKTISLATPWQRISFAGTVKEKFDIDPSDSEEVMLKKLQARGFAKETNRLSRTQIAKVIEEVLEQGLNMNPTFVTDYFSSLCPLAQNKADNPLISERFELYVAGLEIGNAYSELNNPIEQKNRFEDEIKELDPTEKKNVDDDYVLALEHGMPPAGGLGLGIDRLVMLLTDQAAIRDVILFPLLKPENS